LHCKKEAYRGLGSNSRKKMGNFMWTSSWVEGLDNPLTNKENSIGERDHNPTSKAESSKLVDQSRYPLRSRQYALDLIEVGI
jgi:hypothetical protein